MIPSLFCRTTTHLQFSCTRIRTNYLGVNIRYIDNKNEAVTHTLSIVDTKCQHTSRELKVLLVDILDEYQIPLDHVLCCVTDNAANMVKLVKDVNCDLVDALPTATASTSEKLETDSSEDEAGICALFRKPNHIINMGT
jgi:hypothetical protein